MWQGEVLEIILPLPALAEGLDSRISRAPFQLLTIFLLWDSVKCDFIGIFNIFYWSCEHILETGHGHSLQAYVTWYYKKIGLW